MPVGGMDVAVGEIDVAVAGTSFAVAWVGAITAEGTAAVGKPAVGVPQAARRTRGRAMRTSCVLPTG